VIYLLALVDTRSSQSMYEQRERCALFTHALPHVVGAQLYRLSTVDAHTDVLKPIHGKII